MKRFALTGAAGYIAPRHLQAIADTGNTLVAALDPNDSVGILDRYFPDTAFFTDTARFEKHLQTLKADGQGIDYLSICSPNHLHAPHIEMGLRLGADVICEKPLVLHAKELDQIEALEKETGKRVYTLLQLRYHDTIIKLKQQYKDSTEKHQISLKYITSRGPWYHESWKGNYEKSGGPASNIGIHFFDMLMWIFGEVESASISLREVDKLSGKIELKHASVDWYLSLDRHDLPKDVVAKGDRAYREISIDGKEVEFSGGFTDLHTQVYEETLKGNGFGIADARPALELAESFRTMPLSN